MNKMNSMNFDYVIVGGGSAGSVLASRLSQDGSRTVCLIEAGGAGTGSLIRMPFGTAVMMSRKINNWAFNTVPQAGLNGRVGYQPRGKCLGGSSAINAMVYTRGNRRDYDRWASLGCDGWAYDDVMPFFKKSECNARGENEFHGANGPLHVADAVSPRSITKDWIEAGIEAGLRPNNDFNGQDQAGIGLYQTTMFHDKRRGTRCSSAAAFIHPNLERPNLKVLTNCQATKICIENGRATGVELLRDNEKLTVNANAEVILSAGALQTPQLLMLSGIGDEEHLKEHGIEVKHNSPQVGLNLHDHIDLSLNYEVNTTDVLGFALIGSLRVAAQIPRYMINGGGILGSNIAEGGAFFSTTENQDWPNAQLHFGIAKVEDHGRKLSYGYGIAVHVCLLRPKSRGSVRLKNADPLSPPVIDPQFLAEQEDVDTFLAAVKKTRQIMASEPIVSRIKKDITCGDADTDEKLLNVIRNSADTVYHPVGTCRMGSDLDSVVDPSLRVRGIEGLRIADASIIPEINSSNTNAPSIMIGEKAADLIINF